MAFFKKEVGVTLSTKYYNLWTDALLNFIQSLSEKSDKLLTWTNGEGKLAFSHGEHEFFEEKKTYYQNATATCSDELYTLAKDQVIQGFNTWFKAFLLQFPELDSEDTKAKFANFLVYCQDKKFEPLFAARAVMTRQFVQNKLGFNDVIAMYETLGMACKDSVTAMNEEKISSPQKQDIPGPS